MNLTEPDVFLALLVGVTMWVQQKMSSASMSADPRQRQQTQMMIWMMPLMFAFLALSFPSGLSLFWATSSIFRIILQYRVTGWTGLTSQATGETEKDKKFVKFIDETESKPADEVRADVVVEEDESKKKGLTFREKPATPRYESGKDRAPRRRKR